MFSRKNWTSHEKWILRLLLDGESNVMESLRRQLEPPFFSRVQRRRNPGDEQGHSEYHLDVVFNESLLGEFSIGEGVNVDIDDLRIRDQRVAGEIQMVARIRDGLLTRVIARSSKPVSWPRYIRADDWWFVLATEKGPWRSKRRQSLQHLAGLSHEMGSSALLDLPVAKRVEQSQVEAKSSDHASDSDPAPRNESPERSVAQEARHIARQIAGDRQSQTFNALVEEITAEVGPPGTRGLDGRRRPGWSIRTSDKPVEPSQDRPSRPEEADQAAAPGESARQSGANGPAWPSDSGTSGGDAPPGQGEAAAQPEIATQASSRLGLEAEELDGVEAEDPTGEASASVDPNDIRAAVSGAEAGVAEEEPSWATSNTGLSMSWVESFVVNAFDGGDGVDLPPPADREELIALRRTSPPNLPQDLVMFLTHADGARLWGVSILSCHEILQLEEEQDEPRVIFALAARGGSYALDLSGQDAHGPVVLLTRKEEPQVVAESFRAWLDMIERQARAGQVR